MVSTAGTTQVLQNDGSGGLSVLPGGSTAVASPRAIAAGDFNADGRSDLAVGDYAAGKLSILLGNGDGTFQAPQTISVGAGLSGVVVADLNRDGRADLVAANYSSTTVSVLVTAGVAGWSYQPTVRLASDAAGDLIAATDELGHTSRWTYDPAGRVLTAQDPVQAALGVRTTNVYDSWGLLSSTTDADGHKTSYTHNARGFLTAVVDPVNQATTYQSSFGYDAAGNLTSASDPLGHGVSYGYLADNRLQTITPFNMPEQAMQN